MDEQNKVGCYDIRELQKDTLIRLFEDVPGRKLLVLDEYTERLISKIFTMSELFEYDVFLVERLGSMSPEKEASSFKTVLIVKPTIETIDQISRELGTFKYTETYLYFLNSISDKDIEHLAIRDAEVGKIACIKEIFMDYYSINPQTFTVLPGSSEIFSEADILDSILSVLKASRTYPSLAYSSSSRVAESLAFRVEDELRKFLQESTEHEEFAIDKNSSILYIFDRRDDLLTPLRVPWTYQAMISEYLTYKDGKVTLSSGEEFNLNEDHDELYSSTINMDYAAFVKMFTGELNSWKESHKDINNSLSENNLRQSLDKLPDVQRKKKLLDKHLAILEDINNSLMVGDIKEFNKFNLLIFDEKQANEAFEAIREYIRAEKGNLQNRLRAAALYVLRHPGDSHRATLLKNDLLVAGANEESISFLSALVIKNLASPKKQSSHLAALFQTLKQLSKEDTPVLVSTSASLLNGSPGDSILSRLKKPVRRLIVFVLGGLTISESSALLDLKRQFQGLELIVGSTSIINSKEYVYLLIKTFRKANKLIKMQGGIFCLIVPLSS